MENLYDYLMDKFKDLGGAHVAGGFSAEFMLLAFFPLAFIALLRGLHSATAAGLSLLVLALALFSTPSVLKVARENNDHFNTAAFYTAIVMGLVMFLLLGGF